MTIAATALWRRLDLPGHDACVLEMRPEGWIINGAAAYRQATGPAWLTYKVACDKAWRTLSGTIGGFLGPKPIAHSIARRGNAWLLNGETVAGLDHLVDLDLGFTPATNTIQLRRVPLAVGAAAEIPAAWLDVDNGTLSELPQHYERRSETAFWYRAPSFGYEALLEFATNGLIRRYPDLWEAEADG